MIYINSAWNQYFKNRYEGLGTTYERFILHRYFERIKNRYSIRSVLEAPSFGMTGISGINSIWWAFEGIQVTIADHSKERIDLIKEVWQELSLEANFIYYPNGYTCFPFEDHSFDMGWNFAALGFVPHLEKVLKELARVSKKVIFICVPNRLNLFYILRSVFQKNSSSVHANNIDGLKIEEIMLRLKWCIVEKGYLDSPPWPDIAMKKEDLLREVGLRRLAKKLMNREKNHTCILDYYGGKNRDLEKEILKYAFLENSPEILQRFWAHHQYLIFTPRK